MLPPKPGKSSILSCPSQFLHYRVHAYRYDVVGGRKEAKSALLGGFLPLPECRSMSFTDFLYVGVCFVQKELKTLPLFLFRSYFLRERGTP